MSYNSPEYNKLIQEYKDARGERDMAWKTAAQSLVIENDLAAKRKINMANDVKVAHVEAEILKKLLTFRKNDETSAAVLDAPFLASELGFPLVAIHPYADGTPQFPSASSSVSTLVATNMSDLNTPPVVDKIGWDIFSQSFMESVVRSEGQIKFVQSTSGFGFTVVNNDGKEFVLMKPDNSIPQSSQDSLFLNRVFPLERIKKLGVHAGLICDSTLCSNFVSNALLLYGDFADCDTNMISLRLLRKFMDSHMFVKIGKSYPVFEEFIRGEFSTESLFSRDKPVHYGVKLNIFSLLDKPFPTNEREVTMDFVVKVIQRWLDFLQCVCWVHPNLGLDWKTAFEPLISRLTVGDLYTRNSNLLLEIFNRILANWFRLVKNPFYIEEIHFSFAQQKSAIILLKVLLSKLSITSEILSDFMQRCTENRALRCYEYTLVSDKVNNRSVVSNNSAQPCLKWICTSILDKNDHSFYCSPNEATCTRAHLNKSEVIEMKDNIIKMISLSKKCNEKFRDDTVLCLKDLTE
jgi:hypothetical protein